MKKMWEKQAGKSAIVCGRMPTKAVKGIKDLIARMKATRAGNDEKEAERPAFPKVREANRMRPGPDGPGIKRDTGAVG